MAQRAQPQPVDLGNPADDHGEVLEPRFVLGIVGVTLLQMHGNPLVGVVHSEPGAATDR